MEWLVKQAMQPGFWPGFGFGLLYLLAIVLMTRAMKKDKARMARFIYSDEDKWQALKEWGKTVAK
jgi:hypothetical protein